MKNSHLENVWLILERVENVVRDIRSIKIQWATNVAKESFRVLRDGISEISVNSKEEFLDFLKNAIKMLMSARPTEPMLFNGMKYVLWEYDRDKTLSLDKIMDKVDDALDFLLDLIEKWDQLRAKVWAEIIKDGYKVFTHCHSGSVVKVIREARNQWKKFEMYNTETRPLYQWRLTSANLLEIWVPTTLVTDDTASYFIDNTVEPDIAINMVIIGCDAIKRDGSVINKVWSFSLALSAWNSGIPVYVVWSLTKTDFDNVVHIETRSGKEIWPDAPADLKIINYAFDTVPAKFITGVITRDGIVKPNEVENIVSKKYPWMNFKI